MKLPSIWVLTGGKTGDNAQVLRAAQAMELPYDVKRVVLKPEFETVKPRVEASLHIVDLARSDALSPPWPDLVITIGRRLSLPALWIKQQSGGRAKIALFNAPKGRAEDFDLVVAPAHYAIAGGPKVCRIGLPLIAADPRRIAAARQEFAAAFAALARPLHVLLLGGDMGAARLDAGFVTRTLHLMQRGFAREGAIFVSTSRRTPEAATAAAEQALRPQDRLYRWQPDAPSNPYFGLLAHGDTFTVTSDSLSMLTEVARLGRPLAIAEPPASPWRGLAVRLGIGPARDLGKFTDFLLRGGHAVRLGPAVPAPAMSPADDAAAVGQRLKQLVLEHD
ncbi:MAG: ELM1/GtrOC1 family putative glycosyltransferase [Aestuariivirga sp.]|uniref:ELM1/GtrOC1 family putative glycosyltransferase n=1 Tax=Aestuariivirga sp. TaxID=2650926 RepID=UPI0038D1EC05